MLVKGLPPEIYVLRRTSLETIVLQINPYFFFHIGTYEGNLYIKIIELGEKYNFVVNIILFRIVWGSNMCKISDLFF